MNRWEDPRYSNRVTRKWSRLLIFYDYRLFYTPVRVIRNNLRGRIAGKIERDPIAT